MIKLPSERTIIPQNNGRQPTKTSHTKIQIISKGRVQELDGCFQVGTPFPPKNLSSRVNQISLTSKSRISNVMVSDNTTHTFERRNHLLYSVQDRI